MQPFIFSAPVEVPYQQGKLNARPHSDGKYITSTLPVKDATSTAIIGGSILMRFEFEVPTISTQNSGCLLLNRPEPARTSIRVCPMTFSGNGQTLHIY